MLAPSSLIPGYLQEFRNRPCIDLNHFENCLPYHIRDHCGDPGRHPLGRPEETHEASQLLSLVPPDPWLEYENSNLLGN